MFTIPNGVYPTMITPYTKDNEVDYENVKRIASWYIQKGCEGIFSVCQSSEMFYLSLDERVNIAKTVKNTAGPNVCVVASGHTGSSIEEQAYELNAMAETGVDGIVLVSNRLDLHNDGDTVWIKNAEKLLSKIKSDIPLGIYECPHPYKKLLSSAILNWMKETNRFVFIKDTCCSPNLLKQRLELLRGSGIKLYNANGQTLLYSLRLGAGGYSGIMANFHPEIYVWLCKNPDHPYAEKVQTFLSLYAFTEALPYPLTAKYRMSLEGIPVNLESRMVDKKRWDDFAKFMIHQLLDIEKETIEYIKKMDSKSI
jgi:4-hydroxy-tetrahydrodipicolinate synthase